MNYHGNLVRVFTDTWQEYELLDSGNRQRLERVGQHTLIRPEPRAWWQKTLPETEWQKAEAVYQMHGEKGKWLFRKEMPLEWVMEFDRLKLKIKLTNASKHIGVFPEQSSHWQWIYEQVKAAKQSINILSTFGYTGAATLAAAAAGASVTHVDASKPAVTWAVENQVLSNLADKQVRWIVDDAVKFVRREERRGKKYDALILDPPAFGRGPQGQVWKIDADLPNFLEACQRILSDNPLFVILTAYAIDSSAVSLGNLLFDMMKNFAGQIQISELALKPKSPAKLLPLSISARWYN